MPKNVASTLAHRGPGGRDVSAGSVPPLVTSVVRLSRGFLFAKLTVWRIFQIDVFRVTNRARNYVGAAGPLSQINQPATITAEGKVWLVAQDYFLAGRTT